MSFEAEFEVHVVLTSNQMYQRANKHAYPSSRVVWSLAQTSLGRAGSILTCSMGVCVLFTSLAVLKIFDRRHHISGGCAIQVEHEIKIFECSIFFSFSLCFYVFVSFLYISLFPSLFIGINLSLPAFFLLISPFLLVPGLSETWKSENKLFFTCQSQWPRGLGRGSWPLVYWDCGFESHPKAWMFVLIFWCCAVLCR
jgi:hypothetical protein